MKRTAVVVRPYEERIRGRVFTALTSADVTIATDGDIPASASNDEALKALRTRRFDVLVVPFHRTGSRALVRPPAQEIVEA